MTAAARSATRPAPAAGTVRLIGGRWKRSKVPVLDRPGLRPTPDRVRETLFNWLGQDLTGWRVLDAFAGSGALGLEAASRGAAEVVALEHDPALVAALRSVAERLGAQALQVVRADAFAWMAREAAAARRFDLVFIDPPFGADLFLRALGAAAPLLAEGGLAYLEADRAFDAALLAPLGWTVHRQGRAGTVHFQCLRRTPAPGAGTTLPDHRP